MKEGIRGVFSNLPPEGIALHGTNLSRGTRISEEGFLEGTYYIVQPPTQLPLGKVMEEVYEGIEEALKFAYRASNLRRYKLTGTENDRIPVLVVFKPLKNARGGYAHGDLETKKIPVENIIDVVEVPKDLLQRECILIDPRLRPHLRTVLKKIGRNFLESTPINSGGLRRLQKE